MVRMCLEFNPDKFDGDRVLTGKKIALSLVVGYNQSDTSIGWYHFLAGLTLYFTDQKELTLDNIYSGKQI